MKIAIVGSRDFPFPSMVKEFVNSLPIDDEVVSGGARGVDTWAHNAASYRMMKTKTFPADWDNLGKRAGYVRNQQIVDYSDKVIAFSYNNSKGTAHTISIAILAHKLMGVIRAEGFTDDWY